MVDSIRLAEDGHAGLLQNLVLSQLRRFVGEVCIEDSRLGSGDVLGVGRDVADGRFQTSAARPAPAGARSSTATSPAASARDRRKAATLLAR